MKLLRTLLFFLVCITLGLGLGFGGLFSIHYLQKYQQATLSAFTPEQLTQLDPSRPVVLSASSVTQPPLMVYGYLPHFSLGRAIIRPELTHISYFGYFIASNGEFSKAEGEPISAINAYSGERMQEFQALIAEQDQQLELTLIMLNADDIAAFVTNKKAQDVLIQNMKLFVDTQPITGVNLDIEYTGTLTPAIRDGYASFVERFVREVRDPILTANPQARFQVTVAMYGGAATSTDSFWDVERIGRVVDGIVIMAYDFHQTSSTIAGPNAPLFGGSLHGVEGEWSLDIMQSVAAFSRIVPADKLILAVPFYGRSWQISGTTLGAPTYPGSGSSPTYGRIKEMIAEKNLEERWDPQSLVPYVIDKDAGITRLTTYENPRSLAFKLDLVRQAGLKGIAIWALGYEDGQQDLWQIIRQKSR